MIIHFGFLMLAALVFLLLLASVIGLTIHPRSRVLGLFLLPVPVVLLVFGGGALLGRLVVWQASLERQTGAGPWAETPHRGKAIPAFSPTTPKATQGIGVAKAGAEETPEATPSSPGAEAAEGTHSGKSPGATSAEAASGSRPEWVGMSARRTQGGYQMSVATDPFASPFECQRQLPEVLRRAVTEYTAMYLGDEALAAQIELPPEFVRSEIVKAQWEEPFESSVGPMVRLHALLVFDRKVNARIDEAYHQHRIQDRVWRLGVILAGILAVLAFAWAYLKLDLATQGRYRWRLRLAAGLAILGVVAAGWAMWA